MKARNKKQNLFHLPIFLLLVFFSSTLSWPELSFAVEKDPSAVEIISVPKKPDLISRLRLIGREWDFLLETGEKIYLIAKPEDMTILQANRILYRLETSLFPPARPSLSSVNLTSGANGAYHSYQELAAELKSLTQKYPSLAQLKELGPSHEGRYILALKISDNPALNEPEPGVLFLGCHHAREWISVEVPLLIARYLLEHYQDNSAIQGLVNEAQIWVLPLVNPDGLEYSIRVYRYWRKNRRLNDDGTFGVDLNRNYGFNWGIDNRGSSPNPASEVYRGPAPFSEPETRAVRDLFYENQIQGLISYHSYSQVILYPWGFTAAPAEKNSLLFALAQHLSDLMAGVNGRRYTFGQASTLLYLTNGDTTDWAYGVAGIPAFTIELPPVDILHGGFFNAEADIQPIFNENLPAALDLIRWCVDNFSAGYSSTEHRLKNLKTMKMSTWLKAFQSSLTN